MGLHTGAHRWRCCDEAMTADREAGRQARVVLVTGSSSGIGKACCEALSRAGFRVYGGSRTACTAVPWHHLRLDVTDQASVDGAVGEILKREGRIDALVHCAGISVAGALEDVTIEEAE